MDIGFRRQGARHKVERCEPYRTRESGSTLLHSVVFPIFACVVFPQGGRVGLGTFRNRPNPRPNPPLEATPAQESVPTPVPERY